MLPLIQSAVCTSSSKGYKRIISKAAIFRYEPSISWSENSIYLIEIFESWVIEETFDVLEFNSFRLNGLLRFKFFVFNLNFKIFFKVQKFELLKFFKILIAHFFAFLSFS